MVWSAEVLLELLAVRLVLVMELALARLVRQALQPAALLKK